MSQLFNTIEEAGLPRVWIIARLFDGFLAWRVGLNPLKPDRPYLEPLPSATNGAFSLNIQGLFGRNATWEISTGLISWQILTNFTGTHATIYFEDSAATNDGQRFYRVVVP